MSYSRTGRALLLGCTLLASTSNAYVTDAAQQALAAATRDTRAAEDRAIDARIERHVAQHGRPNIIVILADDIGWGELGSYLGGKLRGTPTPSLDKLAAGGMKFLQHYSEPSCTPTRVALLTGRLPVRTGVDEVLFPGQDKGLVAEEKTIAEVLSDAGYRTAMFGKWHVGDHPEHQPAMQGFDHAFYTLYNGSAWPWRENSHFFDSSNEAIGAVPYFMDMPQDYETRYGIPLRGILESRRGQPAVEVAPLSLERYNRHDNELTDRLLEFVDDSARSKEPFFAYFASNANQVFACPPEARNLPDVDRGNCQAAQLVQHDANVARIVRRLADLGIEQNTLLLWVSDNGPMYQYYPSAGFSYLRGGKHEALEGGVRTPAIARWPGMIEPGQDPLDLFHVTDWFTTLARIAGATQHIPLDRVIDGVDQTSLLINGEGHSRRDYVFHYKYAHFGADTNKGAKLAAIRVGEIKQHLDTGDTYHIIRDPREERSLRARHLWVYVPFRRMIYEHQQLMKTYPNRVIVERAGVEAP